MRISRLPFIALRCAAALSWLALLIMLWWASAPVRAQARDAAAPLTPAEQALHVLNRLAYGPRPGELEQVQQMGAKRYIAQQLDPQRTALPPQLQNSLAALPALSMTPAQLFVDYGPPSFAAAGDDRAAQQSTRQRAARELTPQWQQARLLRATESPRQLEEVMTEFWANHFNVFEGKQWVRYWIGDYENRVIRPHALGRFRDLLGAVAHHPAMLYYLDNWLSSGAGTPGARGRFKGLNENYARELMELHTLGVDGGYQQADVVMLARVLSGWTIDVDAMKAGGDAFRFNGRRHDPAPKTFLGHALPSGSGGAGGMAEGEAALDILATQPTTARFICTQLVQYFIADQPDPALVQALAATFLASDGDIRAVLRQLFDSPAFWSRANYQAQFKTPYQFVVSALRASATEVVNPRPVNNVLAQLGMPLYGWLTPEGYKYSQQAWLNPDALLRRINFAAALASGRTAISRPAGPTGPTGQATQAGSTSTLASTDASQLLDTLGPTFDAVARERIQAAPAPLRAALVLGSPDFMKR